MVRPELQKRLYKVARILEALNKLALDEAEFIDRSAARSKQALTNGRKKAEKILSGLPDDPAVSAVLEALTGAVTAPGVVNVDELPSYEKALGGLILKLKRSRIPGGTSAARGLFYMLRAATHGSQLQNADVIDNAKASPQHRNRVYEAQERMAESLHKLDANLAEFLNENKKQEPPQDSSAEEAVENQLREIEADMRQDLTALTSLIEKVAEDIAGPDLSEPISENIQVVFSGGNVNSRVNRDKDFYEDAIHLEHSVSRRVDIGEFLGSKNKKKIYAAYKALILAIKALGFIQFMKKRPDLVINNPKVPNIVVKAQRILKDRKRRIVSTLSGLRRDKDEDNKGAPIGTFSDEFGEAA